MAIRTRKPRAKAERNPSRSPEFSVRDFFNRFPDDDTCVAHVMNVRYGLRHVCAKCGQDATFHRLAKRKAYSCARCGHHVYPCAGTVFEDSRTSMQLWFYAIFLFVTTRHGVSGKELQRSLGVTYKTAWRMGQQSARLCPRPMASKSCKDTSNLTKPMSAAVAQANAAAVLLARPSCLA